MKHLPKGLRDVIQAFASLIGVFLLMCGALSLVMGLPRAAANFATGGACFLAISHEIDHGRL